MVTPESIVLAMGSRPTSYNMYPGPQLWSGVIATLNRRTAILVGGNLYPLIIENPQVDAQLSKLRPDDLVGGYGFFQDGALSLRSVEFVGLKSLIGQWKASDQSIRFKDFQTLKWGLKSEGSYTLLPTESPDVWTFLVSARGGVKSAELERLPNQVVIRFPNDAGATEKLTFFPPQ